MPDGALELPRGLLRRMGLRDIVAIIAFVVSIATYGESLRRDAAELRQEIIELKSDVRKHEALLSTKAIDDARVDERLNAILFRIGNIEAYMRKLAQ